MRYNKPGFQAQARRIARLRGTRNGRIYRALRIENLRRSAEASR